MIDLAENVRGYAAFRLFVYTHILVLRASWGPEHEDQEALPGGTEDLESGTFRTSGRSLLPVISDLSTTFLIAFTCSCRIVNDCKFRWFKVFKRGSSKLLLNRKRAEVLKSRTSNPLSQSLLVLMLRPPGGSGAENAAQKRRLGSPKNTGVLETVLWVHIFENAGLSFFVWTNEFRNMSRTRSPSIW